MKRITIILFVSLLCLSSINTFSQTAQTERIRAAYMLTFGRDASSSEVTYWLTRGALTIPQLITYHRQYLLQDYSTHTATINRAYLDALGRNCTSAEAAYWVKGNDSYTMLVANHITWLKGNPAEYVKVIQNSYATVFNRYPSAAEITYWQGQGVYSYLMLVGMHRDYKARQISKESGSGTLNLTNATNMKYVPLSAGILAEAKSAISLSSGGNVVAAGAGNIVAAGGGNIVAAGGGNVVAGGAGN